MRKHDAWQARSWELFSNVVLRATNIDLATNLLIFDELKYISDKVVVPEGKKVKKGSLMICTASGSKSHLGKVAYIDDDYGYAFGGFMGMLTPLNGLSPRYLFHLMTSEDYKDFIGALSDGANIVSGRSKCTRLVDSKCTTFEGLIAPSAASAALRRERPQSEPTTIDPSPSRPRLVAAAHSPGAGHPPPDGGRLPGRGKTRDFDRRPC